MITPKNFLQLNEVYVSTSTQGDQEVEEMVEQITEVISKSYITLHMFVVMRDSNAKVGCKQEHSENKTGEYEYGDRNRVVECY